MCTAATYKTKDFYMGRTLDYECSYGEEVTIDVYKRQQFVLLMKMAIRVSVRAARFTLQ